MTALTVGARVRVKHELADSLLMPERRLVAEGRLATVTQPPPDGRPPACWAIEFDVKRKGARPVRLWFREGELEIVT